ncbi:hypothetical protein ABPG74_008655 [Tetrahymena malaccensis]
MDRRRSHKSRLYCHFFSSERSCFKGRRCNFIHDQSFSYCPNGNNCPIKVDHEQQRTSSPELEPASRRKHKHHEREQSNSSDDDDDQGYERIRKVQIVQRNESNEANMAIPTNEFIIDSQMKSSNQKNSSTLLINKELPIEIKQLLSKYYSRQQEAHNFLHNFYFLKEDMQNFLPIFQNLFPKMELDLMFIVDCTGSMSDWIDAVKLEITGIVAAIKNQYRGSQIRFSFVGYRDYGDRERYSIFEFSDDLQKFQDFVTKVDAYGGDDAAEDVAGGFKNANAQNWKSKAKYAVLLADAPAHGIIYHGDKADFYDRYPNGDPDGVNLKNEFYDLIKKGVKLYAVDIMKSTKMMYDIFKKYNQEINGEELIIPKLGNCTQGFGQFITQTASLTLSQSYTKQTKEDPQGAFYKALQICKGMQTSQSVDFLERYNLSSLKLNEKGESEQKKDKKEVTFILSPSKTFSVSEKAENMKAICHTYFIVQDKDTVINWRKPLLQNSSIKTTIKISDVPFAEGAMRYAFYAYDTLLNQKLVAKLNKKQIQNNPELEKEQMVKDLESQYICQHIVNTFNDRVSEYVQSTENLKNFVHCFIYELESPDPENEFKYYSVENYIEGEYVKFNNNAGWTNFKFDEPGLLSQALSHYSYQMTEGYLLIVDLQGVGGLLTDPQIHCMDQNRFGSGNLGYQGIFKFFLTHQCNKYCQNLNLIHPNISQLPKDLSFFSSKLERPKDPKKKVYCMCDLCKEPFQTTAEYVYNKRKDCYEKYCPSCDQKRQNTLKQAYCTSCNAQFKSSTYWFLMKRTDFPELCGPCRKKRRERLRAELN